MICPPWPVDRPRPGAAVGVAGDREGSQGRAGGAVVALADRLSSFQPLRQEKAVLTA